MTPKSWLRFPIIGRFIRALWQWDAHQKTRLILPHIKQGNRILDVGSGPGTLAMELFQQDLKPELLDVEDQSFFPETRARIYDGVIFPYPDQSFDVVLLLTVLHHAQDPDQLIREAKRVGKKILILEDVYNNPIQKKVTHWVDSLVNLEFTGHPHNNRSDGHWKRTFSEMQLTVEEEQAYPFLAFFRQVLYVLK